MKYSINNYKQTILSDICYTARVYERFNKKLCVMLSNEKIEELIFEIIKEANIVEFRKIGKNIYITHNERNIRLTINSHTNRLITADKLKRHEAAKINTHN